MEQRSNALNTWIQKVLPALFTEPVVPNDWQLDVVAGDASFRRYFRLKYRGKSWILMDAPPDKENSKSFIDICQQMSAASIAVPHIYNVDLEQGFMLLEDFGEQLYLDQLNNNTVERLYADAIDTLCQIQLCSANDLPIYDSVLLQTEMRLFVDWFLQGMLKLTISPQQEQQLQAVFDTLIDSALQQPKVFVHRDYHSRNLIYRADSTPGVIDFQDAVKGPITYDLVSLLRDCYINWTDAQIYRWVQSYYNNQIQVGTLLPNIDQFTSWFDLMGAQRHLKAIGIFARLHLRDGKSAYLQDIPRTLNYLLMVLDKYKSTKETAAWLQQLLSIAMARTNLLKPESIK